VDENNHLRGSARLSGDTTALCESDRSREKRHGQPEPRNGYTAGGCPTRGAERGTAGGDGLRASGSVRTVPLFDRRHESVSRRDDDAVAQAVASPTFLVIALRWIALR